MRETSRRLESYLVNGFARPIKERERRRETERKNEENENEFEISLLSNSEIEMFICALRESKFLAISV